MTMQKGIFHIELTNGPMMRNSKAKNYSDSCRLDHKAKSFIIINSRLLVKTLCHQTCFVSVNDAISVLFDTINPLASDFVLGW